MPGRRASTFAPTPQTWRCWSAEARRSARGSSRCAYGNGSRPRTRSEGPRPGAERPSIGSADLLAQPDDDAFRSADVGEPVGVPVLHHLTHQLGAVGEDTRDDSVEVVDGEHDATEAQ